MIKANGGNLTLTDITALIGALVGTSAFVLSIINYLRDAPAVTVNLAWDMETDDSRRVGMRFGIVTVSNSGRRPIFLSHVSLKLPTGYAHTHLVLAEGLQGKRLAEGDPPFVSTANQRGLEEYAKDWHKIRAVAFDLRHKQYRSKRPDKSHPPSWARS